MDCQKHITQVTLYFDVSSPYAYVAFESLQRYQQRGDIKVKCIPFFLTDLMVQADNDQRKSTVKCKSVYKLKDIAILSDYWDISIKIPRQYYLKLDETSTLRAQCFLTSILVNEKRYMVPAMREIYKNIFVNGKISHFDADFQQIAEKINLGGNLLAKILEDMESTHIKNTLLANTNEALSQGAFGAPWIVVKDADEKEVFFFGSDRLPQILKIAGKQFAGNLSNLNCKL
uniref:Glutathione S-transferase kappa n=1 Tax=Rhabditophanes sp. KR3021 TaxID=114890 RepID=A0AC35TPX2_9BILA